MKLRWQLIYGDIWQIKSNNGLLWVSVDVTKQKITPEFLIFINSYLNGRMKNA